MIRGFFRWIILSIVRIFMFLFLLAIWFLLFLGAWHLVKFFGDKVFPIVIFTYMCSMRLKSMVFLDSRFCSDNTSTYDRIFNPHKYGFRYLTWEDNFRLFVIRNNPSLRDKSDFGMIPLPFRMSERESVSSYLSKTFLWSFLVTLFCVAMYFGWLQNPLAWLVHGWAISTFLGLEAMRLEKRVGRPVRFLRRRIRFINRNPMEIFQVFSLKLANRKYFISKFRSRSVTILVILVELTYWVVYRLTS